MTNAENVEDSAPSENSGENPSPSSSCSNLIDRNNSDPAQQFCSYAVTGPKEAFQAIFVCHSCCSENDGGGLLCLCQACADECHGDHEGLEYVGMGPSYCDCNKLKGGGCCNIASKSQQRAALLGLGPQNNRSPNSSMSFYGASVSDAGAPDEVQTRYTRDVFQITALENETFCSRLRRQAQTLVRHSRDTFWLDAEPDGGVSSLCDLELLAFTIFRQHMKNYNALLQRLKEGNNVCKTRSGETTASFSCVGAEWWVQVKSVSEPPDLNSPGAPSRLQTYANPSESVDLHYDKDEALAESFGIGSFPVFSTVTYLTESRNAAPTVIFDLRYDEGGGGPSHNDSISNMTVCHPSRGKHLVFDGRLLHGVPSHYALRPFPTTPSEKADEGYDNYNEEEEEIRITFLVNLWLNHKPAGVQMLPTKIRDAIQASTNDSFNSNATLSFMDGTLFRSLHISNVELTEESELPLSLRGRISLPFVGGKDTTWGDDYDEEKDDESAAMVLVTYPPPKHDTGSFTVHFGPGLEAYLDYADEESEDRDRKLPNAT